MFIESVFMVVVPGFTLGMLAAGFWRTFGRLRTLDELTRFVGQLKLEEEGAWERLDKKFLEAGEDISVVWSSYKDSLVSSQGKRHRSTEAAEHFHSNELVDPVLWLDFSRHLPGILTGLGIICTFYGMKTGLGTASRSLAAPRTTTSPTAAPITPASTATPAAQAGPSGQEGDLTRMVQELLNQIEPAIKLSLVAVTCAIVFLLIERLLYSRMQSSLVRLQRALDRKFPRVTEGALLQQLTSLSNEIRDHSYEAMNSLKGQNTDFAVMLEQAMSKAIGAHSTGPDAPKRSLIGSVDELSKKLDESMGKISNEASDASSKTLSQLVEKFQTSLLDGAHGQIKDMLSSIEGVKGLLEEQRVAQSTFVSSISGAARQLQDEVLQQVRSFPSSIAGEITRHQEAVARSSSETLSRIGEDVGAHLMRSQDHQNQVLRDMRAHFDDSLRQLSGQITEGSRTQMAGLQGLLNSIEDLSNRLGQTSQQVLEQGSKATADSMATLSKFAATMADEVARMQQQQTERTVAALDQIGRVVGEHLMKSQQHQSKVLDEMRDYFDDSLRTMSSQITESSNASLAGFDGLLKTVQQLSDNTARSSQQIIEQGSQATVASIESLSRSMLASTRTYSEELLDTMRQFRVGFESSLDRLSNQVENSASSSQETSASLLAAAKALTTHVESSTQALAAQLQAGTHSSLNAVTQNLQDLTRQQFGDVQVSLEQAMQTLMSSTESMLKESRTANQQINTQMATLLGKLDSFGTSTQANHEKFAATVRQATQDIERLLGGIESPLTRMKGLSESFLRQTEHLETMASKLGEASSVLDTSAQQISLSLQESKASRLQTDRSLTTAAELGKSVEQYQKVLTQILEATRNQVADLKRFVEDFHVTSASAFAQMKSDSESYHEAFHEGARKFLHEVDINLSKGAGALSGAIEDLAEELDNLRQVTRGMSR